MKFHLFIVGALLASLIASAGGPVSELHNRQKDIDNCYQRYSNGGGKDKGVVVMKWHIDDHGRAVGLTFDQKHSTLNDHSLSSCLMELVKSVEFAPTTSGQLVMTSYRFIFQ